MLFDISRLYFIFVRCGNDSFTMPLFQHRSHAEINLVGRRWLRVVFVVPTTSGIERKIKKQKQDSGVIWLLLESPYTFACTGRTPAWPWCMTVISIRDSSDGPAFKGIKIIKNKNIDLPVGRDGPLLR